MKQLPECRAPIQDVWIQANCVRSANEARIGREVKPYILGSSFLQGCFTLQPGNESVPFGVKNSLKLILDHVYCNKVPGDYTTKA